ncbi:MAG: extracellular solute-binding protein [Bacillota bacterium]|nr:extracellular solute-binding protein [Bacillota bacterium]
MKRLLQLVLVLCLLASVLTGCQQTSDTTESAATTATTATTKAQTTTASAEPEKYDLYFWLASAPNTTPIENSLTDKWLAELMPDVTIHWLDPGDNAVTTINLMVSAGNTPEWIRGLGVPDYNKYYEEGIIREIDPAMVQQYMPGLYDQYKRVYSDLDDPFLYTRRGPDKKNYGIQNFWEIGIYSRAIGVRLDWLENVGINKIPETLDEFEEMLRAFTQDDPDGNGADDTFGFAATSLDTLDVLSYVFGAYGTYPGIFTIKDGTVVRGEVEAETKDALTVLKRWYDNGYLDPEFMVNQTDNLREKVINEQAGSTMSWWYHFYPPEVFYSGYFVVNMADTEAEWTTIEPPVGPSGDRGSRQLSPGSVVNCFRADLTDDKVAKYLEAFNLSMYETEGLDFRFYGLEGVTYNKTADGKYEWIEPYSENQKRLDIGHYIFAGNFNDYYVQRPYMTADEFIETRAAAEAKNYGDYDRLAIVPMAAWDENKDRLTQLTTTAFVEFIIGSRSLDEFNAFVGEWYASGGQQVIAEAQKAYDDLVK